MAEGGVAGAKPGGLQNCLVGNAAKGQHRPQLWHRSHLIGQEPVAGGNLKRSRQVRWRHAPDRIGNPTIKQSHPVGWICPILTDGTAKLQQCLIKQGASEIAGKWSARAVRSAHTWGETDDQESGIQRPKTGHRTVVPGGIRRSICLTIATKSRAQRTVRRRPLIIHAGLCLGGLVWISKRFRRRIPSARGSHALFGLASRKLWRNLR